MATPEAPAPDTPLETVDATFYLGGQPYIFDRDECSKAGPEFASAAFYETYRALWQLFADAHAGKVPRREFVTTTTELLLGALHLRGLIPSGDRLLPNGHFTQIH